MLKNVLISIYSCSVIYCIMVLISIIYSIRSFWMLIGYKSFNYYSVGELTPLTVKVHDSQHSLGLLWSSSRSCKALRCVWAHYPAAVWISQTRTYSMSLKIGVVGNWSSYCFRVACTTLFSLAMIWCPLLLRVTICQVSLYHTAT